MEKETRSLHQIPLVMKRQVVFQQVLVEQEHRLRIQDQSQVATHHSEAPVVVCIIQLNFHLRICIPIMMLGNSLDDNQNPFLDPAAKSTTASPVLPAPVKKPASQVFSDSD